MTGRVARGAAAVVRALSRCATEAELVQVLYAELHPAFGYDCINLQVLEREGWYHSRAVDGGLLQEVRRRRLVESYFAGCYTEPRPHVVEPPPALAQWQGHRPRALIWVPVLHEGRSVGSISYQLYVNREVPPQEVAFLEAVHDHLGPLVSSAYLNELTRNQAVRLGALNSIARELSATHDEEGVVHALLATLDAWIPVDELEVAVRSDAGGQRVRFIAGAPGASATRSWTAAGTRRLGAVWLVLHGDPGQLMVDQGPSAPFRSFAAVPIVEGGQVCGVLTARGRQPGAYGESTLAFLQQVADQVGLALRNARSYAAVEAQRRRLEIVNAVGRRLVSSLDRWSIMRIVREELGRYLEFDLFALATVTETPDGPVAEGHSWDSGEEHQDQVPVPLASGGPSREAYESGQTVLIHRASFAHRLERGPRSRGDRIVGEGVVVDVTRPGRHRRVVSRSIIWVPVRHGEETTALLTLQSYRADVFDEWHVQVLEDVVTYVGLALANAEHYHAAQAERNRLTALHLLELGVSTAAGEQEIAEALVHAVGSYVDAEVLLLVYVDSRGRVTGFGSRDGGSVRRLEPVDPEPPHSLTRLLAEGATIAGPTPARLREPLASAGWPAWGPAGPNQMLAVPLFSEQRVVGAVVAQRAADVPFPPEVIQLLESAAPVIGIALRTVRLHRANELALANSIRLQMVAGLAGHDMEGVLASIADQARSMLDATGVACWAFDDEGRVADRAASGGGQPGRVLRWSGRTAARSWAELPRGQLTGAGRGIRWTLVPLWYGDRLVGAFGAVCAPIGFGEGVAAVGDFAQHAAIAIENARLAAETRGRVHTLEAVAEFANLDITRPERARAEMSRLIEQALAGSRGEMWLLEGATMVTGPAGRPSKRIAMTKPDWWGPALQVGRAGHASRRLSSLLRSTGDPRSDLATLAYPVMVDDVVVGMLTADATAASPAETRRLMAVLVSQAQLVLSRLQLVDELSRQRDMLETVVRHSPVGVVLEDDAGNIAYLSSEVERIYDVRSDALVGMRAGSLLDGRARTVLADPDPGRPMEVRLEPRGTVVRVRRVPIPSSAGQPARVLTLHEDVTQERAMLEARELMLRAIGHEVRSPAAAMRSTISGLLQWGTVMDADQRHSLVLEAYEQSERLLSLVENQLLISRLEAGSFEPNRRAQALARSVEQVQGVLRNRYGGRVDVIDVHLSNDLPDAYCEPTHLDQVLTNLIGNALEYPRARHVRVAARSSGDWLEVTVADDGEGMSPERASALFTKTAPPGQNRSRGGLGLGLYLCRLVVERSFGGRIWVEATGPTGTTFKFTVPATVG